MEIKIVEWEPKCKQVRRDSLDFGDAFSYCGVACLITASGFMHVNDQEGVGVHPSDMVTPMRITPVEGQEGSFILSPVMEEEPEALKVCLCALSKGSVFVFHGDKTAWVKLKVNYRLIDWAADHNTCTDVYPLKRNDDGTYSYATTMEEVAIL